MLKRKIEKILGRINNIIVILEEWHIQQNIETGRYIESYGEDEKSAYYAFLMYCMKRFGNDVDCKVYFNEKALVLKITPTYAFKVITDLFVDDEDEDDDELEDKHVFN